MRKLRKKQELQDKRDRIRMGLLPPDPPKGTHIFMTYFPILPQLKSSLSDHQCVSPI